MGGRGKNTMSKSLYKEMVTTSKDLERVRRELTMCRANVDRLDDEHRRISMKMRTLTEKAYIGSVLECTYERPILLHKDAKVIEAIRTKSSGIEIIDNGIKVRYTATCRTNIPNVSMVSWVISGPVNLYVSGLSPSTLKDILFNLFDRKVHMKEDVLRVGFSKTRVSDCHRTDHPGGWSGRPKYDWEAWLELDVVVVYRKFMRASGQRALLEKLLPCEEDCHKGNSCDQ